MLPVIRSMTRVDVSLLAAWMIELPLWQRYGLTTAKVESGFATGMARGDWLISADGETVACGFAWAIPQGSFGRSPYLRLIGVRADAAGAGIGAALLSEIERRSAEVASDLFLLP